eukprot:g33238.t1
MDEGGNLILEAEDVGEILKEYLASVFTQEKDMEDREISMEHADMLQHFEIKIEVEVMTVINEGRAVDVVYMDFSKVFEKVLMVGSSRRLRCTGSM